jgi:hypothetical protein
MASPAIETTQTSQRFNPTQAACHCSRLVALALDEEGLHLLVLQDLHGRLLGSVVLRDREERLLRLRHHRAREVVLVDRVVLGRHGPVQQWHDVAKDARRVGVAENDGGTVQSQEVVSVDRKCLGIHFAASFPLSSPRHSRSTLTTSRDVCRCVRSICFDYPIVLQQFAYQPGVGFSIAGVWKRAAIRYSGRSSLPWGPKGSVGGTAAGSGCHATTRLYPAIQHMNEIPCASIYDRGTNR